jgi:hypothetical protein
LILHVHIISFSKNLVKLYVVWILKKKALFIGTEVVRSSCTQ